jgi:tRNA(adenine34) deaminase
MPSVDTVALMSEALQLSRQALAAGDEPFGAVVVTAAGTVGDRNRVVTADDPTAHSEVMAIRTAAARWGSASLLDAVMVTSYEPCPMCLGAIIEAGLRSVVIGARRVLGEAPLGNYRCEALLEMMGRSADLQVASGPMAAEMAEFYATVS